MSELVDWWKKDLRPVTVGGRIALSLLEMTWQPPPDGADDSFRGLYSTRVRGTGLSISPPGGWHAMEIAVEDARIAYFVIANAIDSELVKGD